MAVFRIVELVRREHFVEADTWEEAKARVEDGDVSGGEDYDWEIILVNDDNYNVLYSN